MKVLAVQSPAVSVRGAVTVSIVASELAVNNVNKVFTSSVPAQEI